jgi:hypothetical protein
MAQDPKSYSMISLQRKVKQPLTKEDVTFSVERYSEGYQATLWLPCLGDSMEFVGEVGKDAKEAEKLACTQAIASYAEEIEALEAEAPPSKRQRKADESVSRPTDLPDTQGDNPKARLNIFMQKYIGKSLTHEGRLVAWDYEV